MTDATEILPCRHCGHRPDRRRRICPQCGRPRWFLLLLPLLAVGLIWLALHLLFGAGDGPPGLAARQEASRRMDRGEWAEAERLLRRAIERSDATIADRRNLARCLVETGRPDAAIPLLRSVNEEQPGDVRTGVRLAELLFARGDTVEARGVVDAALGRHPEDPEARLLAARVAAAMGDREEAKNHLRRVRAARPDDPLVPFRLAALGGESAERHLEEAERLERSAPSGALFEVPLLLRTTALLEAGDLERAEALTAAAVEARPDDAEALAARGLVLLRLDRFDDAAKTLARAAGEDANGAAPYLLGLTLEVAGRPEEARDAFRRAAETGTPDRRFDARRHLLALERR